MSNNDIRKRYSDLVLALNLDEATNNEAWNNYEKMRTKYTLEGDQLSWLVCALYASCRLRTVPTVGRPGNVTQGNYVSLTRMLVHCNLKFFQFLCKMKKWVDMSNFGEEFCRKVDILERNFAVSKNIFIKYKPIFLNLFKNPATEPVRPPRSRKQRRLPCNSLEVMNFGWNLFILIKGKYQNIPQDLVSCYFLLLSCIDLLYANIVLSKRIDLLNPECEGIPRAVFATDSNSLSSYPTSILDYLCKKFEGVSVETMTVRDYYWKPNIQDLLNKHILKGNPDGTALLDQNFDQNCKEVKKAYEEYLLSCGEFDERMFLNEEDSSRIAPPQSNEPPSSEQQLPYDGIANARKNLSFGQEDHHLIRQTPITGRRYTVDRPSISGTLVTVVTSGLQMIYSLIAGRKTNASDVLLKIFSEMSQNPTEKIESSLKEMSENFCELYTKTAQDYVGVDKRTAEMRLQMAQMLYYTFLEHILVDEKKRDVDLWCVLKEDLFHRTLFTCCLEIVLVSYNDARKFPWSLEVGKVKPYHFIRIIELVIRSEKQSNNQLSRELVKHLKGIEEHILDSLAWKSDSPIWDALEQVENNVPMCQDVNYSDQLQTDGNPAQVLLSPYSNMQFNNPQQSPISTLSERFQSPLPANSSAKRTLFPMNSNSNIPAINVTMSSPPNQQLPPPISPATLQMNDNSSLIFTSPTDAAAKKKEKPKRAGSLALFFRKFYTLASMRLGELCKDLGIAEQDFRKKIWTCFEHSIIHYVSLIKDRHMDQMIMCAIYIMCKVTNIEKSFQEIMRNYRNQPQAASHIYRSVLISKDVNHSQSSQSNSNQNNGPPPTPTQMGGTSSNFRNEERGDLIIFYNKIYVQNMKEFALKFKSAQGGDLPTLSPLPIARQAPLSPRRRISSNSSVFINPLNNSQCPMEGDTATSGRNSLPYIFNRSPAKHLMAINSRINSQYSGKRRLDLSAPVSKPMFKKSRLIADGLSSCLENKTTTDNVSNINDSNINLLNQTDNSMMINSNN